MARGARSLLLAYAAAVVTATTLGSVIQTQFNLAFLIRLGADVPFPTRLATTAADLIGFAPLYGAFVAVALALAFLVTEPLARRVEARLFLLFALSGATGIAVALIALNAVLPMTPIAATRASGAIALLALAGAAGGAVYHLVRSRSGWSAGPDS